MFPVEGSGQICPVNEAGQGGAQVLPTHTRILFEAAVRRAAAALRAGEVVALPTETVYGLAANAFDAEAVARIYQIKGRPDGNPVIVHVADREMAKRCVRVWPAIADKLAFAFWPGPLTLVLPRADVIPDRVTAGGDTVGVRWPSHPFMQAVIRECGFPLAAPSANPSNAVSPTTAAHVEKSLGARLRWIVDGGASQVGIESTVLDLTGSRPRVLRPGMIHEESLRAAAGEGAVWESAGGGAEDGVLRSPGQLPKHYAPRAGLVVWHWDDDAELQARLSGLKSGAGRIHIIAHTKIPALEGRADVSVVPHDAEAYARALYAELHRCDEEGAGWIIIEAPPEGPEWRAIRDRLGRAASEKAVGGF